MTLPLSSAPNPQALDEHFVQFYEDDEFLLNEVSRFIGDGLQSGQGCVVIATRAHLDDLERRLQLDRCASGLHSGEYIALDAAETLSRFMVGDDPDERLFAEVVGGIIRRAARNGSRSVRAFGEMVALLWADGRHEAALRLEELWNDLARTESFALFCAYPIQKFQREEHRDPFLRICQAHSRVQAAESFVATMAPHDLHRQVALLQQKAAALEEEVARRREAEQALRRRERELSDFLENAVEGLHRVGPDGTILWANKAELDMLGYEPGEYVGHNIAEFHVDARGIQEILAKLRRGEILYDQPARLRCRDGSIKHVLIHSNVLMENGEFVYTRCFTRDVTERVRLEQELQRQLGNLAESDRRKTEFLAMLGHELRNPLAAIVNAVELMRMLHDDPSRLGSLREMVARQSATMTRLVNDLLDIARISQGKIELKPEPVLLGTLVERAVELVSPLVAERNHHLAVDLPDEPVSLNGDPTRLVQVLANLLNNAAKYTPPGGHLSLSARREADGLRFCVRDDGIGLSSELCERIFEPFVQGTDASQPSRGGLGIGLTLVRTLVELHGGAIEALSDGPGRGSEFVVRLPLAPVAEPATVLA